MSTPLPPRGTAIGGRPVVLSRPTARRILDAVDQVERIGQLRAPRTGGDRGQGRSSGAWGYLAAGASITGASGSTLGSGTVTLCSRSGTTLAADGDSVTVLNAGGEVVAGTGGRYLKIGWTDGAWSLDVFPCD